MTMQPKRLPRALWFALAAVVAQPALAQVPQAAAGAAVRDMMGGHVGTVTAADAAEITVRTDRHEIRLPTSALVPYEGVFLVNLSREQLNDAADRTIAARMGSPAEDVAATSQAPADVTSGAGTQNADTPPH